MDADSISPLSLWLLLPVLIAVVAIGRWLAWPLWRLALIWIPEFWHLLLQVPLPDTLSWRIGRRWPRFTAWITGRVDPHRFAGLPLTLIVLLALYLVSLAAGVLEAVLENEELVALDSHINQALTVMRDDRFVHLFHWISGMGHTNTLAIVLTVAILLLWAQGRLADLYGLILAAGASSTVTWIGKYVIDRERPASLTFAEALSPSFPSGHATGSMAVYGFITFVVARQLLGPRQQFEVVYWGLTLVGLIAFSRMVLSLHYFSDVAAGLLIGAFGVVAGIALAEYRRERDAEPAQP